MKAAIVAAGQLAPATTGISLADVARAWAAAGGTRVIFTTG